MSGSPSSVQMYNAGSAFDVSRNVASAMEVNRSGCFTTRILGAPKSTVQVKVVTPTLPSASAAAT